LEAALHRYHYLGYRSRVGRNSRYRGGSRGTKKLGQEGRESEQAKGSEK